MSAMRVMSPLSQRRRSTACEPSSIHAPPPPSVRYSSQSNKAPRVNDGSQDPRINDRFGAACLLAEAGHKCCCTLHSCFFHGFDHLFRIGSVCRHWLFAEDVLSSLGRGDHLISVARILRVHHHHVNVVPTDEAFP